MTQKSGWDISVTFACYWCLLHGFSVILTVISSKDTIGEIVRFNTRKNDDIFHTIIQLYKGLIGGSNKITMIFPWNIFFPCSVEILLKLWGYFCEWFLCIEKIKNQIYIYLYIYNKFLRDCQSVPNINTNMAYIVLTLSRARSQTF